jgi:hypothetical protein
LNWILKGISNPNDPKIRCYFVSVENIELIAMEISNLAFLEHLTLSFDE